MINKVFLASAICCLILVSAIDCKTSRQNSDVAAKEFCDCLRNNQGSGRDSALNYCHTLLANKYRMVKIYLNTRDTFINEFYSKKTIDSVQYFIARFAKAVDDCNPPFWFDDKLSH